MSPAKKPCVIIVSVLLVLFCSSPVEAFLFHATRKAAARRIVSRGFSASRFSGEARFGKGLYLSTKSSTAVAEKGAKSSVLRFFKGSFLKKRQNSIDLRKPSPQKLRGLVGEKTELRGTVKNDVIGPKLGRRLGGTAGSQGKAVQYRSVKDGSTNVVIPQKLFQKRRDFIRFDKLIK